MNENPSRGQHLGIKRPALRQEHRKRAVWWLSASLIAVLVAYFLPVEQIQMRGDQLKGLVGAQGYGPGSWPPTPNPGDDPVVGAFVSNGHHFTITYIGTDITAGRTDPSTFFRPTVDYTATVDPLSSAPWATHLETTDPGDFMDFNALSHNWLDSAPNYVGAGDPTYYGPFSSGISGIPNCRYVDLIVGSLAEEPMRGTATYQTNYPFFAYKIVCSDPPTSAPGGVASFGITVNSAQGFIAYAWYHPTRDESGTIHAVVTTAKGHTASLDKTYTAVGGYPPPSTFPSYSDGDSFIARTYDDSQGILMEPAGDGSGNFVGYLYIAIDPQLTVTTSGSMWAQSYVESDWLVWPWSVVCPP